LFPIESICDLIIFITRKVRAKARRILSPVIKLLEYCKNIKIKIWYQKMTNIIFYVINIPFIVINNVDIEYYKFVEKRSTSDIFELLALGGGADAFQFIPQYALDYWHVTIITIIQIFLLLKIKKFDTKGLNGIREIFKKIGVFIRNKNEGLTNYKRIISIIFILVLLFISLTLSKYLPFLLFINLLVITFIFIGYFITYILNPDLNIKKWIIYILIGYLLIYFYLQNIWSRTDTWNVIVFLIYMCIPIFLVFLRWLNKISYSDFNKWLTSFIVPIILLGISYIILINNLSGYQEVQITAVSNKFIFFLSSIIILFMTSLFMLMRFYPKQKRIKEIIIFLLSCYILVLGARGGIQFKPIKTIDAGVLSNPSNSDLVLNSPFCILHSYFSKGLKRYNYFTEEELNGHYSTTHDVYNEDEGGFQKKNVVIIILESFSKEYVGYYNKGKTGYTPFLDDIIPHSLVMENGYANGVKSIEAVPAITSSIPTLDYEPFITSTYATNSCNSLASLLKEEGYSTSFFHGGARGTMGFYSYTQKTGFNKYFGIEEYENDIVSLNKSETETESSDLRHMIKKYWWILLNICIIIFFLYLLYFKKQKIKKYLPFFAATIVIVNAYGVYSLNNSKKSANKITGKDKYHDGVWGAYDGPFFKYFSEHLNKEQEPFATTFFSITSHPPFTLPEGAGTFPKGNNSYHETVGYTDQMLKEFFERSKKEEWYKNTLFIITADHTSGESSDSDYKNRVGRYSIPIIYFMGDSSLKGSNATITQQIDVMPTILDILNYNKKFFGFGKSVLGKSISSDESWAISNMYYDKYVLIHEDGFLFGIDEEYTNYSDPDQKEKTKINEDAIKLLKAIKQKYNNSLLDNKMNINED
jgi:phosphoglycerol transferase MdoB-like AlkP superfamily enzyme